GSPAAQAAFRDCDWRRLGKAGEVVINERANCHSPPRKARVNSAPYLRPLASRPTMTVSVVVPICNELENISLLYQQLAAVLPSMNRPWEIVFVDDGSTDGSSERLKQIAAADEHVKVVRFRRNYGQTAAMQAGIHHSTGN